MWVRQYLFRKKGFLEDLFGNLHYSENDYSTCYLVEGKHLDRDTYFLKMLHTICQMKGIQAFLDDVVLFLPFFPRSSSQDRLFSHTETTSTSAKMLLFLVGTSHFSLNFQLNMDVVLCLLFFPLEKFALTATGCL